MAKKKSAKKETIIPATGGLPSLPVEQGEWLGSGSTLLNLACSGHTGGAFYPGGIFHLPGDSDTGKTWICMSAFAEAAQNPAYDNHLLVYDNIEQGTLMDIRACFGQRAADRIQQPPRGTSQWLEDVYFSIDELLDAGQPFIYVLDSMDAADSQAAQERAAADKEARDAGKAPTGAYKTEKAVINSARLRTISQRLPANKSMMFVISQTRDNLAGGMFGPTKRYSGGKSLKYYTRLQMWFSSGKALHKTVRGKKHHIGITCKVRIAKNHVYGRRADVEFPILSHYGIDDTGSCIDWLAANSNTWKKRDLSIDAPDFDFSGTKAKLVSMIENDGRHKELHMVVSQVWSEINEALKQDRPSRYT